jgi:hypothetical protein
MKHHLRKLSRLLNRAAIESSCCCDSASLTAELDLRFAIHDPPEVDASSLVESTLAAEAPTATTMAGTGGVDVDVGGLFGNASADKQPRGSSFSDRS